MHKKKSFPLEVYNSVKNVFRTRKGFKDYLD